MSTKVHLVKAMVFPVVMYGYRKRQNDMIPKEELPGSLGAQYATGDQWRHNSRKNERMEPKQKQYPAVDVTGDRSKI